MENWRYKLKDGVYYMTQNGQEIPVDIDAPPKFKAIADNIIKEAVDSLTTIIELPQLPFDLSDLEPFISAETIDYHYNKHHQKYIDTINEMIKGTDLEGLSLIELMKVSLNNQKLFNNVCAAKNHNFYWQTLNGKQSNGKASLMLLDKIAEGHKSLKKFCKTLIKTGNQHFGNGWLWAAYDKDKKVIKIFVQSCTDVKMINMHPLLVIDLWEHAYYLDYKNERRDYLDAVVNNLIDWSFVSNNFEKAVSI